MAQKVLVLSASVGAGHLRAAQAVELALKELRPDLNVQNIDVLTLTNAPFRRIYAKAYLDLVNKAPHVLGYMYDMLDKPSSTGQNRRDRLRLSFEKLNLRDFTKLICEEPPSLVINTHFLPASIVAHLRKCQECTVPQVTVTTDFDTHRLWVNQPCEHYFTANQEGALTLAGWGVPQEQITATGIPIHPVFARPAERDQLLKQHGLFVDRPIVLQLAGGFGVGPIQKIHEHLLSVEKPIQLITVTGKNAAAKEQLESVPCPPRHRRHLLGFTDQIDQFMAVADIVVSKPGGLTTSETLARGCAMLIVDPIPGQETRNADFLLENGAALKVNSLATLTHKLNQLLVNEARLKNLKDNARRLGRPRAAYDVVEKAMQFAKTAGNTVTDFATTQALSENPLRLRRSG